MGEFLPDGTSQIHGTCFQMAIVKEGTMTPRESIFAVMNWLEANVPGHSLASRLVAEGGLYAGTAMFLKNLFALSLQQTEDILQAWLWEEQ